MRGVIGTVSVKNCAVGKSKATGPLTPGGPLCKCTLGALTTAAPRWMCMTVASATLCVQTSENELVAESNCPMQPPRSVVGTGGTSLAPDKSKTKIFELNERRLWNVQVTAAPACRLIVALRSNGFPVLPGSSQ